MKYQTPKSVTFSFQKMCLKIPLLRYYCKNRPCFEKKSYKLFVYSSDLTLQWAVTDNKEYVGSCWTKIKRRKKEIRKIIHESRPQKLSMAEASRVFQVHQSQPLLQHGHPKQCDHVQVAFEDLQELSGQPL